MSSSTRGEANALITFLEAREFVPNESQRQRIIECIDLEQLNSWVRKVATLVVA